MRLRILCIKFSAHQVAGKHDDAWLDSESHCDVHPLLHAKLTVSRQPSQGSCGNCYNRLMISIWLFMPLLSADRDRATCARSLRDTFHQRKSWTKTSVRMVLRPTLTALITCSGSAAQPILYPDKWWRSGVCAKWRRVPSG